MKGLTIPTSQLFASIIAVLGVLPAAVLAQENPVPIETTPTATSTAIGEVAITVPDPVPAAGDSSQAVAEVRVEVEPGETHAKSKATPGASLAIASVAVEGQDLEPAPSERIVLNRIEPTEQPLVNIDDKQREFPAVEKRAGRVYLVLPSSFKTEAALTAPAAADVTVEENDEP